MKIERRINNGFTLLELLIVILIIGILAAIALPQYKMVVGKAKFSELKTITKSVQQSAQRYYMIHNTYVGITKSDLDIEIKQSCTIWNEKQQNYVACGKKIFGKSISFYMNREKGTPALCIAFSTDVNDHVNHLCQKETGKTGILTNGSYYVYYY